jgi:phenylpropionate dioxygenase-like ring-hydroxylating dioxygenase large terminal subunit
MSMTLGAQKFERVRRPLNQAAWMPKEMYLDREIFDLELEKIFRKEWMFVAHVGEVANKGDFIATKLAGEPVLIVRDKQEVVRAFYNVCKHRAMAVATGTGKAVSFVCPYHAWNYGLDGELIAAPGMNKAENFDPCTVKLRSIRSEIVNGMIFINFDDDAQPLADRIPDLIDLISPWNIAEMEPVHVSEIGGDYNWKVMLENANENYHSIAVHRESFHTISPAEQSYSSDGQSRPWHDLYTPYSGPEPMVAGPKIDGVPEWSGTRLSFFALHPQFLMSVSEDSIATYVTHIDGHEKTRFVWTMYMMKGAKDRPGAAEYIADMGAWIDRINSEDLVICEGVQAGLKSEGWEPARFSHLEKSIWQFQNWYLDRMVGPAPHVKLAATS